MLSADDVEAHVDENTIAVGAVLGTTHIGEADPIEEINDLLVRIKAEKGWDIPLHVDGASGAFIAPFAEPDLRWDFRLEQVASINVSGPQVRPGLPGRRLADLPGRVEAARGPRVQRELPRRRAADVHVQLLARVGHDPGADVQLPAARAQRVHRRSSRRCWPTPGSSTRASRRAAGSRSSTPGWPSRWSRSRIKGDPGFDVYHLSARLREDGWIVPAYSLPPDADAVHLMRVVVRLDLSRMMIEQLLRDLMVAWDALVAEQPVQRPTAKPDLWTSPAHAAAKSKARTGLQK